MVIFYYKKYGKYILSYILWLKITINNIRLAEQKVLIFGNTKYRDNALLKN